MQKKRSVSKKKVKTGVGVSGKYRMKKYKSLPSFVPAWLSAWLYGKGLLEWRLKSKSKWQKNLVVAGTNTGTGLIAQRLIGAKTYDIEITQAKIGKGTTPPDVTDTDLEVVSLAGIVRARQTFTADSATIEFFVAGNSLPNDTYTEFGLFCGDQMFTRSLFNPAHTKSTNEDTGIEYLIEINTVEGS